MKKLLLGFLMSLMLVANSFAVNVPSTYQNMYSNDPKINSYKHNTKNIYVINAVIGQFELDFGSVGNQYGVNENGHKLYLKSEIDNHWVKSGAPYATLNGAFFADKALDVFGVPIPGAIARSNLAAISFPLKGSGHIYQNQDTEARFMKRTLYMYKDILPLFVNGYSSSLFNNSYVSDAIVAFNPYQYTVINEKLKADKKIGRHYIGCLAYREYTSMTICNNLLFFYSEKATHYEILNEMYSWGVQPKHIMVMDGSGSAQLYSDSMKSYGRLELYGYSSLLGADYRKLPSTISIFSR